MLIPRSGGTKYFGVITVREYIKIQEERIPFWHFLDELPDGWLTSLAYKHVDMPTDRPQLWDCGAWSYKNEVLPKLKGSLVTPEWALEQYAAHAEPGAFVVAPDHLLIDGVDLVQRRAFNATSARAFLAPARAAGFRPMAVIHGMDAAERSTHAQRLLDMGYDALAVGGVAARASQQQKVFEIVEQAAKLIEALRAATPAAWLHVLGLSAPSYMAAWQRMGVDSCDGSSHFKQAFTAGAFYVHEAGRLIRHQAARRDPDTGGLLQPVPSIECTCKACRLLREQGIDTRTYGSNENNMGRAAHNLNMLLRAHRYVTRKTVYLVSCVGEKKAEPAPAADLYQSEWFLRARRYVEAQQTSWYILSAEHGLVAPKQLLAPYNRTLKASDAATRLHWAHEVAEALGERHREPTRFVILAGKAYRQHLLPMLEAAGHEVDVPMEGLGIGQQLRWLKGHNAHQLAPFESLPR